MKLICFFNDLTQITQSVTYPPKIIKIHQKQLYSAKESTSFDISNEYKNVLA